LESHGAVLVDADVIAREVVEPGTDGLAAVVAEFGSGVLAADGTLDRSALGSVVFDDEDRRQALNAIIHPLVYRRRSELVAAAPKDAIVVEDIPLLVENELGAHYQLVVVVHAPAADRVQRLVDDRGMSAQDGWSRIRAQATDNERRAAADVWLDNTGDMADTLASVDTLWSERLVPFEANLRSGARAPRPPQAILAEPDSRWPADAQRLMERIRRIAGDRAGRIDHVGSTSVPGLAAKDVIDLQVVTQDLERAAGLAHDLVEAGLVAMPDRWFDIGRDGTEHDKSIAVNADPGRAANVHIRPADSPTWRDALLLRDWLRANPAGVEEYAALKKRLASAPHESIDDYAYSKTPWINDALARADTWAATSGWTAHLG
jgi:dephospho-CoA kinase